MHGDTDSIITMLLDFYEKKNPPPQHHFTDAMEEGTFKISKVGIKKDKAREQKK
jgi:hypothetical protein